MKDLVLVLGLAVVLTSCQKDELSEVIVEQQQQEQQSEQLTDNSGEWFTSNMYGAGLNLELLEGQVCSPTLVVETQVSIYSLEIDGNNLIITDINGVSEVKSFDYHESYLVPSAGGSVYSVEALRINNGEGGVEEYELLFDYCGGDNDNSKLTFYNTLTGRMILTNR